MKKLFFLNGALLAAVLNGYAIVATENDGYDHHVLARSPKKKKDDVSLFTAFSTQNYAAKSNEFIEGDTYNATVSARDAQKDFTANVLAMENFKKQFARDENIAPENFEEEGSDQEEAAEAEKE